MTSGEAGSVSTTKAGLMVGMSVTVSGRRRCYLRQFSIILTTPAAPIVEPVKIGGAVSKANPYDKQHPRACSVDA